MLIFLQIFWRKWTMYSKWCRLSIIASNLSNDLLFTTEKWRITAMYLLPISLWKRNRAWQSQSANLRHTNHQRGSVLSLSITVDRDSNFSERFVYPWFTKVQKQSLCFVCLESIFPTCISMAFDNILKSIFENALRKKKIKHIFYLYLVQGVCLMINLSRADKY